MDREKTRQLIYNIGHIEHLISCPDHIIFLAGKNRFLDFVDESIMKYVQRRRWEITI